MDDHSTASANRIEADLPDDVHALLERAAVAEGKSLRDFVVDAATEAARRTVGEVEIIHLSKEDQEALADQLINPPPLAPSMKRAIDRHKLLFGSFGGDE